MKITFVVGTRPEFIKCAPVVAELRRHGESPTIIATGQHTDLLRGTPFDDAMAPDVNLGLPGTNDPLRYAGLLNAVLRARWGPRRPDMVIVQGDTASAYAGACAGQELGIPVAHIEAGVRSGDINDPWPEEIFRTNIDNRSTILLCATRHAMGNLCVENSIGDRPSDPMPVVTGNPGIDALYSHTHPLQHPQKMQDRVLVTLHRRESFGAPLARIVSGLLQAALHYLSLEFVWPTHPNPQVQAGIPVSRPLPPNLLLLSPLSMVPFARMLAASRCVLTDSGGVQEEAAALGVPCLVAREKTDRPESVEIGLAKVVGRTPEGILQGLDWALGFQARCTPSDCFGDGHASERIVSHLLNGAIP